MLKISSPTKKSGSLFRKGEGVVPPEPARDFPVAQGHIGFYLQRSLGILKFRDAAVLIQMCKVAENAPYVIPSTTQTTNYNHNGTPLKSIFQGHYMRIFSTEEDVSESRLE